MAVDPTDPAAATAAPDLHDGKRRPPVMLTDLALRMEPDHEPISWRFMENPDEFADAFARAWFKLLHRDMGLVSPTRPRGACRGNDLGTGASWSHELIDDADIAALRDKVPQTRAVDCGTVRGLGFGASTFRQRQAGATKRYPCAPGTSDRMGGQQPGPIAEGPGRNSRALRSPCLRWGKQISMADLIVLGGCAAVEQVPTLESTSWCPSPWAH